MANGQVSRRKLRDNQLIAKYNHLDQVKELKHEAIVRRLCIEYFISARTVEAILRGEYDKRRPKDHSGILPLGPTQLQLDYTSV